MRCLLLVLLASAHAHAEDVAVGAALGAGGQGDASYGAMELRLDAKWRGVHIGLGGRAVFEGGTFRTREWSRPIDAVTLIRQLEAHLGPVALAAGALSPSVLGRVVDGYRATLDDRARTGARVALNTGERPAFDLEAIVEIDDVLDPALAGGALACQLAPAWGLRAATAVDPATSRVAIELGGARRRERDDSRIELGASIVGERWLSETPDSPPGGQDPAAMSSHVGVGAVGFASVAFDRAGARWTLDADIRAGTGTNGAAFGPLYRAERAAILDDTRAGIGSGLAASVSGDRGWLSIGGRWRPGLGALGTSSVGAPMGSRWQAAAWIAASPRAIAGAGELRAVWATHLSTSLQLARMYTDAISPMGTSTETSSLAPAWSATVWFGVSTR
ncbi:MAG: hypothetical protein ACKV2T_00855 [Kofleriaceae bacterium]